MTRWYGHGLRARARGKGGVAVCLSLCPGPPPSFCSVRCSVPLKSVHTKRDTEPCNAVTNGRRWVFWPASIFESVIRMIRFVILPKRLS